jgi:hypothetical protein
MIWLLAVIGTLFFSLVIFDTWRQSIFSLVAAAAWFIWGLLVHLWHLFNWTLWIAVGLTLAFAYALHTANQPMMLIVMSVTAVLWLTTTVFSNMVSGWFRGNRDITRNLSLVFMWLAINTVLAGYGPNFYQNHFAAIWFITLTGLVFVAFGIYRNITSDTAGFVLVGIYLVLVFGMFFEPPHAIDGLIRWASAKDEQSDTNLDRKSIAVETDARMTLAVMNGPSVAYMFDTTTSAFNPVDSVKFSKTDTLAVNDHNSEPVRQNGAELMYEVVSKNIYGDYFGTNYWIPARKMSLTSPLGQKKDKKDTNAQAGQNGKPMPGPQLPPAEKRSGQYATGAVGDTVWTGIYVDAHDEIDYRQYTPQVGFKILRTTKPPILVKNRTQMVTTVSQGVRPSEIRLVSMGPNTVWINTKKL